MNNSSNSTIIENTSENTSATEKTQETQGQNNGTETTKTETNLFNAVPQNIRPRNDYYSRQKRGATEPTLGNGAFFLETKILDMISYGNQRIKMFPKRERPLRDTIYDLMLSMIKDVEEVKFKNKKMVPLNRLDLSLHILQILIAFASNKDNFNGFIAKRDPETGKKMKDENGETILVEIAPPLSLHQYAEWSRQITECGKILGGYEKSLNDQQKK